MANRRLREEVYDTARGLQDLGLVDAETLREFDKSRLPELKQYCAADIKRLRLKAKTSQSVFAAYLNTSVSTVQKWEIGDKKTSGPALKLLNIVARKGLKALA
jgi:putative transcriptional regulator